MLFFKILHTSQHVAGDGAQRLILRPTTVSTVHLFGPLIHIHAHVAAQRNKLPLNIIPRLIPDVVTAPVLPAFFLWSCSDSLWSLLLFGGHLHREENSGHSCFHLGFNHTNPPIQTLAAAGAAVHLSAVRCHPENIKKLLVSWTVAPGAAETRQPQFEISRLHVLIWACHGGWFCPSHVLFCGKTSVSGVQLDSQTFSILNVVFYVIGTRI